MTCKKSIIGLRLYSKLEGLDPGILEYWGGGGWMLKGRMDIFLSKLFNFKI